MKKAVRIEARHNGEVFCMASWMVHLRIADRILTGRGGLEETEFVVGNIAPDSGVPSADWSSFNPPTEISHFKKQENGLKKICIGCYAEQYLTEEMRARYGKKQESFYLGYYAHLLTDILWAEEIFAESVRADLEAYEADPVNTVWKWKKDWYDLDFLYLQKHPEFHAFSVYESAEGFVNTYMDIFAPDAFEDRRKYITGFYREKREGLIREYPWLSEERMEEFVETASGRILKDPVVRKGVFR